MIIEVKYENKFNLWEEFKAAINMKMKNVIVIEKKVKVLEECIQF